MDEPKRWRDYIAHELDVQEITIVEESDEDYQTTEENDDE